MSRRRSIPKYTLHKPSGQGRARQNGRDFYFGPFDSDESKQKYARFVAELASRPNDVQSAGATTSEILISELILYYLRFAKGYYRQNPREVGSLASALRIVNKLYGDTPAVSFGPLRLKAVISKMIEDRLSRKEINRRLSRIKRAFKWGVSEEHVPPSVFEGLRVVGGLRYGRTEARETEPVRPVDIGVVERTLPYLSPQVAAIVRVQLATGMRPSEVLAMRPCDIDRSQETWVYKPAKHKTQHLGFEKHVPLGPRAKATIEPFLDRKPDAYLFSPAEAEEWRNKERAKKRNLKRKTPIYPSELKARDKRREAAKRRKRKRPFAAKYNASSYRQAIEYGIKKAARAGDKIERWFPYQLRHTHGTEVRKKFGLEAAQVALGHATADVTQIYAERNMELAKQVAANMG